MELPFQWDDGNFVSPFVASSEEYLVGVSRWLLEHSILPAARTAANTAGDTAPVEVLFELADLGCGDGAALFFLAEHIAAQWEEAQLTGSPSTAAPGGGARLRITALGVDLDEALVDEAAATAKEKEKDKEKAATATVTTTFRFICEDIRSCDIDALFPAYTSPSGPPSPAALRARPVLYLYLVPEGLEAVRDSIVGISCARQWLVASNRWPIPFLENSTRTDAVGPVTLYTPTAQGSSGEVGKDGLHA